MRLILYLGADFFCPLQGGGRAGPLPVCSITEENYCPGVRARKPFIWGKEIEDKLKLMVTLFFKNPPFVPQ